MEKIQTPRGTFSVQTVFETVEEALAAGFGFYFENDDGRGIWTKHLDENHCIFAVGPAVSVML